MTVNSLSITSGPYDGNDVADEFSYYFRVEDKTQLTVYETDDEGVETILTVDTDYTVAGIGVDAGGIITRVAGALPTAYTWFIRSNYIETQLTAFGSQGGFFPDVHEAAMDKLTFLIQQIEDVLGRSMRLSDGYSGNASTTLPTPAPENFLRWKADLTGLENVLILSTGAPAVINPSYLSYYDCDLEAAVAAIGSIKTHLIIDCTPLTLTTTLTINVNTTVEWRHGYEAAGDVLINFNGVLIAGPYQIFSITSKPTVVFGDKVPEMYLEWFGGSPDATSTVNTTAFADAIGTSTKPIIQLLEGTYEIGKDDATFGAIYTSTRTVIIKGLSEELTKIENTHATGAGIRFSGSSGKLIDLTYDNGSSTGYGVAFFAQNTQIVNVQMQNQGISGQYMLLVDGATGWQLDNVKINLGINNALHIGETLATGHISINNLAIDKCTGTQMKLNAVAGSVLKGVLLDEGGADGSIIMTSCSQLTWQGLSTEYTSEITLTGDQFISMDNCDSVFWRDTRINHTGGTASKKIFATLSAIATNNNIVWDGLDFDTDQTGVTIFDTSGSDSGISIKNIRQNSSNAIVGVSNTSVINSETIHGWTDSNVIATHVLDAINLYVNGVDGAMSITKRDGQTLVNSLGVVTGTAEKSVTRIPTYSETVTEAGNLTEYGESLLSSTASGARAQTLRDGEIPGVIKTIRMTANGGDITLTVSGHVTSTSWTFNAVGDTAVFMWTGLNWVTIYSVGV